uniref:DDE Tnp4 domain-containing protein n=1 Tax=Brassica oleracea var. oleracea TaxID=109376 RepID=A0A0D3DNG5_BRAOL
MRPPRVSRSPSNLSATLWVDLLDASVISSPNLLLKIISPRRLTSMKKDFAYVSKIQKEIWSDEETNVRQTRGVQCIDYESSPQYRLGLSALQKCTVAIRVLAYGTAADTVDEYLRLGETTTRSCVENFVEGIIYLFGDECLRRPTPADLQRTLNDINVLDRSPVFDDIINGQTPQVTYSVNEREYHLAYYLTDGIYPKWATFIQSISLPQGPKAVLFAQRQEAVRKDVELAFGVLQARFAIVKNPVLFWDKVKIGKIMRACIILHNMIVEDERDGYTQFDVSEFQQGEDNGSSHVDLTYSTDIPTNIANMMSVRTRIRDRQMHEQLKGDLVEHVWCKFGRDEDNQ